MGEPLLGPDFEQYGIELGHRNFGDEIAQGVPADLKYNLITADSRHSEQDLFVSLRI